MKLSPIKEMALGAVLWLPLCFFLWFYLASPIVFPVSWLTNLVLTWLAPGIVDHVQQFGYILEVQTLLPPAQAVAGAGQGTPVIVLQFNPMIYAYGFPLLAGLVMATPTSGWRRAAQIAIGYSILVPVQVWGVSWEVLKTVGFELGPSGRQAVQAAGFNLDVVALCYQFGYLIFPAVAPIIIWLFSNRRFLETLVAMPAGAEAAGGAEKKSPETD